MFLFNSKSYSRRYVNNRLKRPWAIPAGKPGQKGIVFMMLEDYQNAILERYGKKKPGLIK
jgi:hypothetical protein